MTRWSVFRSKISRTKGQPFAKQGPGDSQGAKLATRNSRHFEGMGLVNPLDGAMGTRVLDVCEIPAGLPQEMGESPGQPLPG